MVFVKKLSLKIIFPYFTSFADKLKAYSPNIIMDDLTQFQENIQHTGWSLFMILAAFGAGVLVSFVLLRTLRFLIAGKDKFLANSLKMNIRGSVYALVGLTFIHIINPLIIFPQPLDLYYRKGLHILLIASVAWIIINIFYVLEDLVYRAYDIDIQNNLSGRRVRTQFQFLKRFFIIFVVVITIALIFMSFQRVRELGASILASAGIAGIIIGFAAQRSIANLLAGFQIAFTQPIRIDDVVLVENEWGRIEEINLTYVVVRLWDMRRLVLPITYFIEKPFQNWTRTGSDLIGSVFLYVDYTVPVEALRNELNDILEASPLWDKKTSVLQVTNATDKAVELRILVSAPNAPVAWDLRCLVREKMIAFIRDSYPGALPRVRAEMKSGPLES